MMSSILRKIKKDYSENWIIFFYYNKFLIEN